LSEKLVKHTMVFQRLNRYDCRGEESVLIPRLLVAFR
jgi:hypothetical protein